MQAVRGKTPECNLEIHHLNVITEKLTFTNQVVDANALTTFLHHFPYWLKPKMHKGPSFHLLLSLNLPHLSLVLKHEDSYRQINYHPQCSVSTPCKRC